MPRDDRNTYVTYSLDWLSDLELHVIAERLAADGYEQITDTKGDFVTFMRKGGESWKI